MKPPARRAIDHNVSPSEYKHWRSTRGSCRSFLSIWNTRAWIIATWLLRSWISPVFRIDSIGSRRNWINWRNRTLIKWRELNKKLCVRKLSLSGNNNWTVSFVVNLTIVYHKMWSRRWSRSITSVRGKCTCSLWKAIVRIILDRQHSRRSRSSRFITYYQRAAQRCVQHRRTGRLCWLTEGAFSV